MELAGEVQMSALPALTTPVPIIVYRVTRRMWALIKLLEDGYVAELRVPSGKRPSRTYILRAPAAHETDGAVVTGRMIDKLVEQGWVVRIRMPWSGKTWVYGRNRYYLSQLATITTPEPPCEAISIDSAPTISHAPSTP